MYSQFMMHGEKNIKFNKNLFPKSQRILLLLNNCEVKSDNPDALIKLLL